jgi:O-antigen/teichoic acid export membrane protein
MAVATVQAEGAAAARQMRGNVRAILAGNIVYAIGLWLQLVLFARWGGADAVGAYAFALALAQPVLLLSQMQLRALMASDARGGYSFREYRAVRAVTTAAALAAMVPVAWVTGRWTTLWPMLGPVCAKGVADSLADIYAGLWQQHERMAVGAWMLSLNAAASVTFMAAAAVLGGGAPGMAVGSALGSCLALAFVHLRTHTDRALRSELPRGSRRLEWRRLVRLAREAAPLGVIVLLTSLQANVPRYAIQRFAGTAALGMFVAAFQLTSAGGLVLQALGSAAAPRLARSCAAGDLSAFARLTRKLSLVAAALGAAGVGAAALLGRPVLSIVFRPEFGSAAGVLVVLSVAAGAGFVATLLGFALTAARVLVTQAALLTVTLAVTAAGCLALVPRLGAAGAASALVLAALVQAGWSAAALCRFRTRAAGAPAAAPRAAAATGPSSPGRCRRRPRS